MKLKSLELWDFKGIGHFKMEPEGSDISVRGVNASGKTSLADAVAWLLSDQDSQGASLLPKPLDSTGEAAHGVCSDVEAVFFDDNGEEFTLKKSFKEKFTKKHGSAKKAFTGHTTSYYVNGVPTKEKDYKKYLAEIASEQVFKLLTSTRYFSEGLHWQQRREILLDICGDISDEDIIASDKELFRIPEILDDKTFDERKKIITAQKTKLNKELSELPIRIDEATKGQPNITGLNLPTIEKSLSELSEALILKNEEAARIESGGEIAEKVKKQRIIESELLEIENRITKERNRLEKIQRKQISDLEITREDKESARDKTLKAIKDREATNEAAEKEIIKLRAEWHFINDKVFNERATICPTCGQGYPSNQAEEIREKFHMDKAETLRKIDENGRTTGNGITGRKDLNEIDQDEVSLYEEKIEELAKQISEAEAQAPEPEKEDKPIEKNKEQESLEFDLAELKLNIEGLRANSQEATGKIQTEIFALSERQTDENRKIQTLESHAKDQARIKELGDQQRTVAEKYENLEADLYVMDLFLREKVKLLEEKVNAKFNLAKFSLFEIQVNGALNPICETTYDGIGWHSGLNNSSQNNVGVDVINTLNEYYGLTMPLMIDNAESILKVIPSKSQIIKLVVSETVQCAECDWTGLHSETNKEMDDDGIITGETCPKCGGAIKEYKGLIVRKT